MQICHSLTCKQIDMSTADQLISIFRNNTGIRLPTFLWMLVVLVFNKRETIQKDSSKVVQTIHGEGI